MASDNKDHLGRNDRKDSHYNLILSNGSADLDLMPIRVLNRIVSCEKKKLNSERGTCLQGVILIILF